MNAKQLERLLTPFRVNPSAFDVVTRKLRESFSLATSGRGMNAHNLTIDETAWLLAAYAGSEVAAKAAETLKRLIPLQSDEKVNSGFLFNLQLILRGEITNVQEVRVCKNADLAVIRYQDGTEVKFVRPEHLGEARGFGEAIYRSEGILTGGLLKTLAIEFADGDAAGEFLGE